MLLPSTIYFSDEEGIGTVTLTGISPRSNSPAFPASFK